MNAAIGTACWIFAGAFSALVFADRWTSLSLRFPDFWYQTRNFHVLMCVGLYVAGWLSLRNSRDSEQQDAVAPNFNSVTLYTRPGCELCDKAMAILNGYADRLPTINVVDIDCDPELQKQHRDCIPVVEIDGRVYFRGIVNPTLLERMILARENRQCSESVSPDRVEQVDE
ncbi:MAG: glutaredoxin family protein [Fuerstiella sp.]|nr:glutaredoxin family protein [Fuerstiella sp.]MCP4853361.1 glutaredoxin family protein [Fuerstiella sp.]